jgi:hypothetical protein
LTDLNLFDSTSELLIIGIHQDREIEEAIAKVSISFAIEVEYFSTDADTITDFKFCYINSLRIDLFVFSNKSGS